MVQKEETALVTGDRWLREAGWLDADDRQVIGEASGNGQYHVRFMTIEEMIETMKQEEPAKFKDFHQETERKIGHRLSYQELVEFCAKANERITEFAEAVKSMSLGQATQIRTWRIESHMTWRSLARAAWREKWFNRSWSPPANQIMGMALTERAAQLFGENYQEAPWN